MKHRHILILLLALCLCLCACTNGGGETSTTDSSETTEQTTAALEDFTLYYDLLSPTDGEILRYNWVATAMNCVFSDPLELDLENYFYNGFGETCGWDSLSEDLAQRLVDFGFSTEYGDIIPLPRADVEAVLNQVFDITLDSLTIPDSWYFDQESDTYFTHHGDANVILHFTITDVQEEDDLIRIYYTSDEYTAMGGTRVLADNMCITLRPTGGAYQVVSNEKL